MTAPWGSTIPVVRPTAEDVARWRLPAAQLTALLSWGVPQIEDLVETTGFDGHRLAGRPPEPPFVVVPDTGEVLQNGCLINSSVELWLRSVGLVADWLATSEAYEHYDNHGQACAFCAEAHCGDKACFYYDEVHWHDDDADPGAARTVEDRVLDELAALRDRIAVLDPPAVGDGNHANHFWPATLDRWLF